LKNDPRTIINERTKWNPVQFPLYPGVQFPRTRSCNSPSYQHNETSSEHGGKVYVTMYFTSRLC